MADKLVRIPIGLDDKQARADAKKFVTDFEKEFLRLKKALADALAGGANDVKARKAIEELNATVSKAEESLKSFKAVASDTSGTDKLAQSAESVKESVTGVGNAVGFSSEQLQQVVSRLTETSNSMTTIAGDVESLSKRFRDAGTEAEKATSVWDIAKGTALGIGLTDIADGFMQLGQAALQFGVDSVNAFSSFETGFAQVKTLLPTLGDEGLSAIRQQLIDFGVEVGRTTDETLPALYQALSSGIPQENVFEFLQQANQAALAGVTDLESSVTLLSSIVNAYGADTISVAEASDVLFGTARLGVTTFEEMSKSLSAVTPIASSLNVPLSDIGAQLATITLSGTSTSEATTQMRAAMSELSDASSEAAITLKDLTGVSFADFIDQGNSVGDAFNLLADYAEDTDQSIADLFGSIEAAGAALVISGKGAESYANALKDLQDSTGDTELAAIEFADTLELSKKKSDAALEAYKLQVGEGLQPLAKSYYETAASVLSYLTALAKGDQGSMDALGTVDELDTAMGDLQRTMEDSGASFTDFALALESKNSSDQFLSSLDQTKLKLYETQAALQLLADGFEGTDVQLAEAASQQGLLQMQIDAGTTSLALQRDAISDWTDNIGPALSEADALAIAQKDIAEKTEEAKVATAGNILKVLEETGVVDDATLAILGKNFAQGASLDSIGALIIDQGILTAKEWEYVSAIATAELKTAQLTGKEADWAAQIAANSKVISQNTALLLQNLAARNAISGSAARLISLEGSAVSSAITQSLIEREGKKLLGTPPPLVYGGTGGTGGTGSGGGNYGGSGGSGGRGSSGKSEAEKQAEADAKATEKAEEERLKNEEKFNEKVVGINADILKIRMDNEDKVAELRTKNNEELAKIDSKYNEDVAKQTTEYNRDVASKKLDIADDYYKAQLDNERDLAKITDDENRKLADQKLEYDAEVADLNTKAEKGYYDAQVDHTREIASIQKDEADDVAKRNKEHSADLAKIEKDRVQDIADAEADAAKDRSDEDKEYAQNLYDLKLDYDRDIAKRQRDDADEINEIRKDAENDLQDQKRENAKELAELEKDIADELADKRLQLEKDYNDAKAGFISDQANLFLSNLDKVVKKGVEGLDVGGQGMKLLADEIASGATAEEVGKLAETLGVADANAVKLAASFTQLEEARQAIARADLSPEESAQAFKDVTAAFESGGDIDVALDAYKLKRQSAEEYAAEQTKLQQQEIEDFMVASIIKIVQTKEEAEGKLQAIRDSAAADEKQVATDTNTFKRELDISYNQDTQDAYTAHTQALSDIDTELGIKRKEINDAANLEIKTANETLATDLETIHSDSLAEQTKADEAYKQAKEDIDADLKFNLKEAETNNARDIEKIHQDSLDAQDAANVAYKQEREDIAHDGNVALETLATNHNQKLSDLDAAKNKTIKDANDQLGRDIKAANDDMETKVGEALGKLSGKFLGVKGDANAFKNELVNIGIAADNLSGKSVQIFFDYVERGTKVNAISPDPTNTNVAPKKPASSKVPANAFALGGYTGVGAKDKVAGIVHADEFVVPSDVRKKGLASIIKFVESFDPQFNGSISKSLPNSLDTTVPMIKVPTMSNNAMRNDSPQFSQPSYNDNKNIFFYGYQAERMAQATIGMNRRQFINNLLGRK